MNFAQQIAHSPPQYTTCNGYEMPGTGPGPLITTVSTATSPDSLILNIGIPLPASNINAASKKFDLGYQTYQTV